jgi:hypothetical protein
VRIIVACAGPQTKWGLHLGIPSHFVPVLGEPLLYRTIRQALAACSDIHVTAPVGDARYSLYGTVMHQRGPGWASEFASTRDLWSDTERTVLVYGDVAWSDAAFATVMEPADGFRHYGRAAGSAATGCRWGEGFALSWTPDVHADIDAALEVVHRERAIDQETAKTSRRHRVHPTGWMLDRAMCGVDLRVHNPRPKTFVDLTVLHPGDLTDDFDRPADIARHPWTRAVTV